ncbi:hypothetical protein JHK82_031167 [Glycine max]|nr:hypothetical protein JHK82_031167 [Glycine max]
MAITSSTETIASVNRRGGGDHTSSMGMHGGENGEHGNLPRPLDHGGLIPLYGAAAGSALQRNNNHHHDSMNIAFVTKIVFPTDRKKKAQKEETCLLRPKRKIAPPKYLKDDA